MIATEFRRLAAMLDAGIAPHGDIETPLLRHVVELARETGAPRSRLIRTIADTLDENDALRRETDIAATAVRQSAIVLAVLPVATAIAAAFFGANTLTFLITEPAGWACLVVGIAANIGGWRWMTAIQRRVIAPPVEMGILSDCVAEILSVTGMTPDSESQLERLATSWGSEREWTEVHAIRESSRDTGVPVANLLRHHSRDLRRAARFDVRAQIEGLPGRLLIPLGACLFPAFITLTVIPAIASMAQGFFSRGT